MDLETYEYYQLMLSENPFDLIFNNPQRMKTNTKKRKQIEKMETFDYEEEVKNYHSLEYFSDALMSEGEKILRFSRE